MPITLACEGAAPNECVEYHSLAGSTEEETKARCVGLGGTWRVDGCPRADPWIGECFKPLYSKHYYGAGTAWPELCVSAESGTWKGKDAGPPLSRFEGERDFWRYRVTRLASLLPPALPGPELAPLERVSRLGFGHVAAVSIYGEALAKELETVRAVATPEQMAPLEAERDRLVEAAHAPYDVALEQAFADVLPVLATPIPMTDKAASRQLDMAGGTAVLMAGHLPDPTRACAVGRAVLEQRRQRGEAEAAAELEAELGKVCGGSGR